MQPGKPSHRVYSADSQSQRRVTDDTMLLALSSVAYTKHCTGKPAYSQIQWNVTFYDKTQSFALERMPTGRFSKMWHYMLTDRFSAVRQMTKYKKKHCTRKPAYSQVKCSMTDDRTQHKTLHWESLLKATFSALWQKTKQHNGLHWKVYLQPVSVQCGKWHNTIQSKVMPGAILTKHYPI